MLSLSNRPWNPLWAVLDLFTFIALSESSSQLAVLDFSLCCGSIEACTELVPVGAQKPFCQLGYGVGVGGTGLVHPCMESREEPLGQTEQPSRNQGTLEGQR